MYRGSRDDYRISFAFSTSSTVDISYMKLIAFIFPTSSNADYQILGKDCVEDPTSQIEIEECWLEPGTRLLWIRPVQKTAYTSDMTISVITRDLAIRNPVTNNSVNLAHFSVKFYSWANITEPSLDPINNNNYCFLIINGLGNSYLSYSDNPSSYPTTTFTYLRYPHQRYYTETPYSSLTHSAPFEFMFRPDRTFSSQSGANYHTISVYYGTAFTDNNMFKLRDL